ncbi:hypothetical protein G6663_03925 [Polynucleobacter paneuropaeus]|nr:hypothetical protein [Polynucleobacter paneuropaeus]MBT8612801.1 hypothetical protein [Polynucleobacter paneuropaeus]QWD42848.1 hypothetical protein G6665_01675 [Polynucleobacter paneuropaeus]
MKNDINITIFFHMFKGFHGADLSRYYLEMLRDHLPCNQISIIIYAYGFDHQELTDFQNLLKEKNINFLSLNIYEGSQNCKSEIPTLRRILNHIKNECNDNEFIMYLHSKGASYKDPGESKVIAECSILALAACIQEIIGGSPIQDKYKCYGSFLSLGVFRRFNIMTLAFSGNFWMAKASYLSNLDFPAGAQSEAHHNRHLAEEYLGLKATANEMFNILDFQRKFNSADEKYEFIKLLRFQINFFCSAKETFQNLANQHLNSQIDQLKKQQITYSKKRIFWGLRKYFLGNEAYIRKFKFANFMLERISPWYCCELYRAYILPSHFAGVIKLINKEDLIITK